MSDKGRTARARRSGRSHQALADLAKRQHGVVSLAQLGRLGYSRDAVSYACRSGRLHRLHRGVYAVGHRHLTWHGYCLAAVLAGGPAAVASHWSAAWLWGLTGRSPSRIDVTAPARRRGRPHVHAHYARLVADDRARRDGVPVTALPRTLLDLAAALPRDRLDRVVERAEELRVFDRREVDALLGRCGGHRGRGPLARALAIYRPEPGFARSRLERRFLELVRASDLPEPALNYAVAGFELDVYWHAERFAIELDAFETHGTRRAFEQDRRRQEELKLVGIEMIRMTASRIEAEPQQAIARVAILLEQRRRELGAAAPPNTIPGQ